MEKLTPTIVAIDSCVIMAAFKAAEPHHAPARRLVDLGTAGDVDLRISLLTAQEVIYPAKAVAFAAGLEKFPHHPVGRWDEQGATTWGECNVTWDELSRANDAFDEIRRDSLAKHGAGRGDRGAYLDAVFGGAVKFLTTDPDLGGSDQARRLFARFGLAVETPAAFLAARGC